MLEFYQNIPQKINPVAFSVGFFDVRWYSLMYIIGFSVVVFLLHWRTKRQETDLSWNDIFDFLIYGFVGMLLGGRLGYALLYDWNYYSGHLERVFLPTFVNGKPVGFFGMSYHGALVGFALIAVLFLRKRKISFWKMLDFIVPAVPAGYFFGRLGNFFNGELYGRTTDKCWGMFFGNEKYLRHPSQLYEAFFEGVILFVFLWSVRNKWLKKPGALTGIYILSYGIIRFCLEFFRAPDRQLGFVLRSLTMGQVLSLIMIVSGGIVLKLALNARDC